MKLRQLVAAIAAVAVSVPLEPRVIPDYPGLFFEDGKFEITMFNDLHLGDRGKQGELTRTPKDDNSTIEVMNTVLNHEKTNLAVINGDLMSCEWVDDNGTHPLLDMMMSPFLNRGLHFATTFGNHEWEPTCNTKSMTQYIWDTANNHTAGITFTTSSVDGNPNLVGTSNYFIPIYSTANGKEVLKMILWLFDSKGGFAYTGDSDKKEGVKSYVHNDVVEWFQRTRDELEQKYGGKTIPSLVFFHIPVPATKKIPIPLWSNQMPGIGMENIDSQDPDKSKTLMQALVDTKGLLGVFNGHDHRTDWCMKWNKALDPKGVSWPSEQHYVHLCFGRHTGYGGYSEYMRGGRHIVVHEDALGQDKIDNAIETWNRLENGDVSGRVMLNSTYGKDIYPLVDALYSKGREPPPIQWPPNNVAARNDDKGKGTKTSKSYSKSTKVHSKSKATSTPSSKVSTKTSKPTSTTLGPKVSTPTKTNTTNKATKTP